jgi:hypothetical protein
MKKTPAGAETKYMYLLTISKETNQCLKNAAGLFDSISNHIDDRKSTEERLEMIKAYLGMVGAYLSIIENNLKKLNG